VRSSCCGSIRAAALAYCPYCIVGDPEHTRADWGPEAVDTVIADAKTGAIFTRWPDVIGAITGCLRGLFIASDGCELISSDYTAIEAVVLACLAGEQWRIDVFNTHGKIYEMSAAKISGVPFDEIMAYKKRTGDHHPLRKTVGKVAELASGYGGWVNAWCNFGADQFMTEPEIKGAILRWREESPAIVEFWGGQYRRGERWGDWRPELYGLEGMAIAAVQNPGHWYTYGLIGYYSTGGALFCRLPSGRDIVYQRPQLDAGIDNLGRQAWALSYEGWNSDSSKGPVGWFRKNLYGGLLAENVVQAVSRDIMANGLQNVERAGYFVVLHVHDEIVSEVPAGFGTVEHFEQLMTTLPDWCKGWPIRAAGGWRGRRYRKE
jgi:DNA polymerase